MKAITNKETTIVTKEGDSERKMTYLDLLKLIMNQPPANGYTISEMRQRLKIFAELVEDKKNKINLEDADFTVVKKCVLEFKWAQPHKDIVEFVDHLESL